MSKISDYFARYEKDGKIRWSDNPDERDELADALLGAELVSSLDYWVEHAEDLLSNSQPKVEFPRKNAAYRKDKFYREAFVNLETEERQAFIKLLREIASGVLYSTLLHFDRFHNAQLEIVAIDERTGEKLATLAPKLFELHERLYDWIEKFGEDAEKYQPNQDS